MVTCGGCRPSKSMDRTSRHTECMGQVETRCMSCRYRVWLWSSQPPTSRLPVRALSPTNCSRRSLCPHCSCLDRALHARAPGHGLIPPPYFHDGSAETLADVVEHYDGLF